MNYLLRTYKPDDNIADTEDNFTKFIQPPNKIPSQYAEKLLDRTLRCGSVHEEQLSKELFFKELDKSIRQSMKEYWSTQKSVSHYDTDYHALLLLKLQGGHQGMPSTNTASDKSQS